MEVAGKLRWRDALAFEAEIGGRRIELNSAEEMGKTFSPMELFLVALAGCTAMDIQWILKKQRQKVTKLEISVRGLRREEEPRYYEEINLEYFVGGQDVTKQSVERAIRLSRDKYCSVMAMLRESIRVNTSYTISNDERTEQELETRQV